MTDQKPRPDATATTVANTSSSSAASTEKGVAESPSTGELRADLSSLGWSVCTSERGTNSPSTAYSIGFLKTFGHPEVIITGLDELKLMSEIIAGIGFALKAGRQFEAGHEYSDIIVGYRCAFAPVHRSWAEELMPRAVAINEGADFPALQCFWPDEQGNFPWSPQYNAKYRQAQPILSEDPNQTTGQ